MRIAASEPCSTPTGQSVYSMDPLANPFASTLQTAAEDETPKDAFTKRAWVYGDIRSMLFYIPQMAGSSLSSVAESDPSMLLLRAWRIKAFGPGNS